MTLAASVVATPIVIRLLGPARYGVLSLVNVLVGYATMSDIGMGAASTKYGADALGRGDAIEESSVVWTALLVLLIPTLVTAAGLLLAARVVADHVLHVPDAIRWESIVALRLAALVLVVRALAGVVNTPQMVRLRLDLVSTINNGGAALQILCVPAVLWWLHGGLGAAVAAVVVVGSGIVVAHGIAAVRLLPALRHPRFAAAKARELLRYGFSTAALGIVTLITFNAEKFLVSGFASAEALGYYSVAFSITRMLAVLPGAISQALLPAFARLQTGAGPDEVQRLFERSLRWLLLINLPAALVLVILAGPILRFWGGPDYAVHSAFPLGVLAIGCVANGLCYVPLMLLQGVGRVDIIVRYFAYLLVPYLIVSAACTRLWGPDGAAVAWTVRACVECGLMLMAARRAADVLPWRLRSMRGVVVPAVVAAALLMIAPASLTSTFPGLIAAMAVACGAYAAIAWVMVLTREERAWLLRSAGSMRARISGAAA